MARYRVTKTCFWDRVYQKGEKVSVADGTAVPSHFERLDKKKPAAKKEQAATEAPQE